MVLPPDASAGTAARPDTELDRVRAFARVLDVYFVDPLIGLIVPGVGDGARYKFELLTAAGQLRVKADPMARAAEAAPGTASVITSSNRTRNCGVEP